MTGCCLFGWLLADSGREIVPTDRFMDALPQQHGSVPGELRLRSLTLVEAPMLFTMLAVGGLVVATMLILVDGDPG